MVLGVGFEVRGVTQEPEVPIDSRVGRLKAEALGYLDVRCCPQGSHATHQSSIPKLTPCASGKSAP